MRLSERRRREPRGGDVIVCSPSIPAVPFTGREIVTVGIQPTLDYAAPQLQESRNEFWRKVIASVAVALLIFMSTQQNLWVSLDSSG